MYFHSNKNIQITRWVLKETCFADFAGRPTEGEIHFNS